MPPHRRPGRPLLPARLGHGSNIRVIAPSRSLSIIGVDTRMIAARRFEGMGVRLSFGRNVDAVDGYGSSSVAERIEDLHDAFADPVVDAILTVIGGYSSNELLPEIDRRLVADNPKILCGYSDITALQIAVLRQTGLVTYSGPHHSAAPRPDAGVGRGRPQLASRDRALRSTTARSVDDSVSSSRCARGLGDGRTS